MRKSGSWIGIMFIVGLLASPVWAEEPFSALDWNYFGQAVPGNQAVRFAPGLISLPGRFEFALSFSAVGDELLFTQQVPGQPATVMHSRIEEGRWTEPRSVRLSGGDKAEEMEAFFAPDGRRIYFAPYDEGMDVRIWSVEIHEQGWLEPRKLGSPLADVPAFYPTATVGGALYFTNLAERKVFRARMRNGEVAGIEDAGIQFGGHAFVAPDESFALLDARAPDSLGDSDLYVAFRDPSGGWQTPRHLGAEVNSEYSETCPSLSSDGRFLFFSRYDEEGGISDLYWIDSGIIDGAREPPTASEAFLQISSLAGGWWGRGGVLEGDQGPTRHEFAVAAGGTTVLEIMDLDGERELNLYYLDGDDLFLTHYCGGGSRPRLKLDLEHVSQGVLPFVLGGGSGFDPQVDRHIHNSRLVIREDGSVESHWTAEKAGEVVMRSHFELERKVNE